MKTFTIASIVALASVATAQLDNIPQCALSCFIGPLTSDGCQNLTDFACHCKKGDQLLAKVQPCVQSSCSTADQRSAIAAVESTCKAAGVPITIPDTNAPAPSSMAPKSSIPAPSAAPSPTPSPSASPAPSAAPSGTSEAIMTIVTHSSMHSEMKSSASGTTPTPTGGNSTMPSRSPSASVSQFTGAAAAQATQAIGVIGAAALAMLAL